MDVRRWTIAVIVAAIAAVGLLGCQNDKPETKDAKPGSSEPAVRVVTVDGVDAPGPAKYDKVRVVQQGSEDAKNVLVLAPGTSAGAGYFLPLGADIVKALPDWQVWSVDRRENLLEDHSLSDRYLAGDATNQEVFDYYLQWIEDDSITKHFEPPSDEDVAFAREWGMNVAIGDLDVVVQQAADLGGKVVLGGHSLGGSITVAYATWDFDGKAGAENLSGVALIDGGSAASTAVSVEKTQADLAELATGTPFNDLLGLGLPWAPGVFNLLGSSAALLEPDEPSLAYDFSLLPDDLKPPVAPTNAGQYGYALDVDTSPDYLALVRMHLGQLANSGAPRGWTDDGLVPLARAATMFSGIEGIDGTAWYHPLRLTLDSGAVNGGIANPAQDLVGVRAIHGTELAIPIYALATSFGGERVLIGARAIAQQSAISDDQLTLVDETATLTHTDPMGVKTQENPLLKTIVPFLRNIG